MAEATLGPPFHARRGFGVGGNLAESFSDASANHGFLIRDASENAAGGAEQQLHAREKAPDNPPQLTVTFG